MTEPTLKGFIAFVNEQPADRHITHQAWENCAVGDYISTFEDESAFEFACCVLEKEYNLLYEILNEHGVLAFSAADYERSEDTPDYEWPEDGPDCISTYGDLAAFIRLNPPRGGG